MFWNCPGYSSGAVVLFWNCPGYSSGALGFITDPKSGTEEDAGMIGEAVGIMKLPDVAAGGGWITVISNCKNPPKSNGKRPFTFLPITI